MKINLCKIFGVEEGEEFKLKGEWDNWGKEYLKYKIQNNKIYFDSCSGDGFRISSFKLNELKDITEIIKLPKKKEFTDDELAIMRSLPKEFEWMTRDKAGSVYIFEKKPSKKEYGCWGNGDNYCILVIFNHLFQSIRWEDEEPVFIDDYVERGAENE